MSPSSSIDSRTASSVTSKGGNADLETVLP